MRSMLFVPGDRPERFEKAVASGADAVIFDLEDAVAPAARAKARHDIAHFLRNAPRDLPLWVRINPIANADSIEDLAAVVSARPDGILLPKARNGDDLRRLDHWLEALEVTHLHEQGSIKVIALVTESAGALLHAATFAHTPARVTGFTWGAEDLAADIGAASNRTDTGEYEFAFRVARAFCLLMAAAAGVAAIDTIDANFRDAAALEQRARTARRDGFVGMLAIHPLQVPVIHAAFSPSLEEIDWARRVFEAFASSPGKGTLALDGRMIDRPHLKQAERILAALERR
jgi:citrate lyase subunit beta / citryl-CoA lyase